MYYSGKGKDFEIRHIWIENPLLLFTGCDVTSVSLSIKLGKWNGDKNTDLRGVNND